MPAARKAAAKKTSKKGAKAPKKAAPRKAPAKPARAKAAKAAPTPVPPKAAAPAAPPAKRPRRPAGAPPIERTRVVIAMDFYEPHKDDIKAPFKEAQMKWNFLGEGKGLYKRADGGVHCFTQFKDDGVHYSVWGSDKPACTKLLGVWEKLLGAEGWKKATTSGEQAVAAEKAEAESDALKLWKLAQPQRRPGEPDLFYDKRVAEWQAKRPAQ